jgi:hypothetical protein
MTTETRGRHPSPRPAFAGAVAALVLLAPAYGCAGSHAAPPTEPGLTFAAHAVRDGVVVDTMRGGSPTAVVHHGFSLLHPAFVVEDGPARGEAITPCGPGCAEVRASTAPGAPLVGRVEPRWTDDAIRLTIEPVGAPPIRTTAFLRRDWRGAPSSLTRDVELVTDVNGRYRAELREPSGADVGFLRVQLGTATAAAAVYSGVLPRSIDEGLAAATAVALGSELSWIQDHAHDPFDGDALYKRP